MKKLLLLIFILTQMSFVYAGNPKGIPEDDMETKDSLTLETVTDLTLATRNIWRGISFGQSPSFQGLLEFQYGKFCAGSFGTVTTNGSKVGYGNSVEIFANYGLSENLLIGVKDYYFFNPHDSLDNYFEYGSNTQHYLEAQVTYLWKESVEIMAGYSFYNSSADRTNGVYIETTVFIQDNISVFAGFLTGDSQLNFMDKRGVTNIGVSVDSHVMLTRYSNSLLTTSLIISPNHINITEVPGVGTSPIYLVASLTF